MLPTATVFDVRLCHGLKQPVCGVVRTSYNAAYGYSLWCPVVAIDMV